MLKSKTLAVPRGTESQHVWVSTQTVLEGAPIPEVSRRAPAWEGKGQKTKCNHVHDSAYGGCLGGGAERQATWGSCWGKPGTAQPPPGRPPSGGPWVTVLTSPSGTEDGTEAVKSARVTAERMKDAREGGKEGEARSWP